MNQNSLNLEAAAMLLKLEQNRQALQKQGIQSVSEKLRQLTQNQQQ
jgi:ERCC4-related helicase